MARSRLLVIRPASHQDEAWALDQLLRRFQRLEITMPTAPPAAIEWGKDILQAEKTDSSFNLVHQQFAGDATLASLREKLPASSSIESSPMTLRDIYLALARTSKRSNP